jgi:hypothetical protein
VQHEAVERLAPLRHDEQAAGRPVGDERLLDRTSTGNELLILTEQVGRGDAGSVRVGRPEPFRTGVAAPRAVAAGRIAEPGFWPVAAGSVTERSIAAIAGWSSAAEPTCARGAAGTRGATGAGGALPITLVSRLGRPRPRGAVPRTIAIAAGRPVVSAAPLIEPTASGIAIAECTVRPAVAGRRARPGAPRTRSERPTAIERPVILASAAPVSRRSATRPGRRSAAAWGEAAIRALVAT